MINHPAAASHHRLLTTHHAWVLLLHHSHLLWRGLTALRSHGLGRHLLTAHHTRVLRHLALLLRLHLLLHHLLLLGRRLPLLPCRHLHHLLTLLWRQAVHDSRGLLRLLLSLDCILRLHEGVSQVGYLVLHLGAAAALLKRLVELLERRGVGHAYHILGDAKLLRMLRVDDDAVGQDILVIHADNIAQLNLALLYKVWRAVGGYALRYASIRVLLMAATRVELVDTAHFTLGLAYRPVSLVGIYRAALGETVRAKDSIDGIVEYLYHYNRLK